MIERMLERVQDDVAATRQQVSELNGRFDALERLSGQLDAVEKITHEHVAADAELHGKLSADLHRLWWGAGMVTTAVVGVIVTTIARLIGGAS